MNEYYNLAWFLAFQTPLICFVICIYVFFALQGNGLTRKELICLRIMTVSCIGEMLHEIFAGLVYYGILDSSMNSNVYLYTISYTFMALAAAAFSEFCISRLKSSSGVICGIIRTLYAVIAVLLIARIVFRKTEYFTYINPDNSFGFGKLDDAQTWCCLAVSALTSLQILFRFMNRNEYVGREQNGKLLTASSVVVLVFAVYLLTYTPFVISIGYMFVLLFTVISNQGLLIYTDELTQLNNRRRMLKDIGVIYSENKPWSYIIADVNNFKKVNDEFGHNQGDAALKIFSGVLKSVTLKNEAAAYRMGGDEFSIVVLTNDENTVSAICEEIGYALKQYNINHNLPYDLSASFGYAIFGEDGLNEIPDIIEAADRKMYENKRTRKKQTA